MSTSRMRFSRDSPMSTPSATRQRAAGQAGAVAARDERHASRVTQPDDRLHLRGGRGQDDGARRRPQVNERIGLVGDQIRGVAQQPARADRARELLDEFRFQSANGRGHEGSTR